MIDLEHLLQMEYSRCKSTSLEGLEIVVLWLNMIVPIA